MFGHGEEHLHLIEGALGVRIASRGAMVSIKGNPHDTSIAETTLRTLCEKLREGADISPSDVEGTMRIVMQSKPVNSNGESIMGDVMDREPQTNMWQDLKKTLDEVAIVTPKKRITPYSRVQADYIQALQQRELVFAAGPAGTGKTYLAVAAAVQLFVERRVERIIMSRPAVEAGENLGFLPGDLKEKVDPYLRPMYDALYDTMPAERVVKHIASGEFEIAPLAFMRGRTLRNAYVILDEGQNTSPVQMKMFLTRLGEGSRMVITGDLTQTDLPKTMKSGFRDALEKLSDLDEVSKIRFGSKDVVRHPLTTKIVAAYEKHDVPTKWEQN